MKKQKFVKTPKPELTSESQSVEIEPTARHSAPTTLVVAATSSPLSLAKQNRQIMMFD
jgi:hypothetical protein